VESWTEDDGHIVWKADTGGRSTPIIMDGRVYVIRLTGDGPTWKEEVVCLRESDGEILWRHAFDLFQTDIPSDRVGWTSLAGDPETGYVYAHGVQGMFYLFRPGGQVVWERSLTEEYGRISGYGGRTHTPIVDGDKVIISFLNSGLGPQASGAIAIWR
jgi:outer membrane protein assembly factor BamB